MTTIDDKTACVLNTPSNLIKEDTTSYDEPYRIRGCLKDIKNTSGLIVLEDNNSRLMEDHSDTQNINPASKFKKSLSEKSSTNQNSINPKLKPLDLTTFPSRTVSPILPQAPEIRRVLTTPVQAGVAFRGQIFVKSGNKFELNFEGQGVLAYATKRFCLSKTTYDLAIFQKDTEPQKQTFLGRLTGNFIGSKFNLCDNPDAFPHLSIQYDASCSLDNLPFRVMKVSQLKDSAQISTFQTQKPKYDKAKRAWCLNMDGRAKLGSVNNVKLVDEKTKKKVFLLGKDREGCYNMDACSPLTPLQAFTIAVSSLTYKLCSK